MNLGSLLIVFTALCTAIAMGAYLPGLRRTEGNPRLGVARLAVYLSGLGLVLASAHLWHLILNHQFQYDYIYRYSSRDLPLRYLISSFWGGQEGTFLLWALFGGLLAVFLRFKARHYEAPVQFFYLGINLFLLLIMMKANPFATLPTTPPDGAGLNPLLQDPWMTIHPPVVFFGFAALGIPAAYAMAAMIKEDWDNWIRASLPWTSFGVLALGLGLLLGGYWAYSILGWGGFWGWDPVENSSLVPWLMASVLLHNQLIQLKQGLYRRTNLVMALLPFLLLTYSTFLTRSGILADFSVHSFTDLGINQFLVLFMVAFGGGGFALYIWKQGRVPAVTHGNNFWSREMMTFLGAMSLALFATAVLLGTSAPLITRLTGTPSNVQPEFYNTLVLPFAIIFAILMALAPHFVWKHTERGVLFHRLRWPIIGAVASIPLIFMAGIKSPGHLLLAVVSVLAVFSNLRALWVIVTVNPRAMGGPVAHAGMALCILGILTSTAYTKSETVALPLGHAVSVLGYNMLYGGHRPVENGTKNAYEVAVRTDNRGYLLSPTMFYNEKNQGMMKKPAIQSFITHDVYVAPVRVAHESVDERLRTEIELEKGVPVDDHGEVYLLLGLSTSSLADDGHGHGVEDVVADLRVEVNGVTHDVQSRLRNHGSGQMETFHAAIPGSKHNLALLRADLASGTALVGVQPDPINIEKDQALDLFGFKIHHGGFDVQMDGKSDTRAVVLADVTVAVGPEMLSVRPGIRLLNNGGRSYLEAPIGRTGLNLVLTAFDSNTGGGSFHVVRPSTESLIVEASLKPFILLLWVGTFVATLGLVIATVYRARLSVRKMAKPRQEGAGNGSKDRKRRAAA